MSQSLVELRRPYSSEYPRRPTRRRAKDGVGVGAVACCAKRAARKNVRSGASVTAAGGVVAARFEITSAAFRGGAAISRERGIRKLGASRPRDAQYAAHDRIAPRPKRLREPVEKLHEAEPIKIPASEKRRRSE